MRHDEFIGQVQHLARLSSRGEAEWVTRVVLETLGERIFGGEAKDIASQLPPEIGRHLLQARIKEPYSLDEFFRRVVARERIDPPRAIYHARVVIDVLMRAISPGEMRDLMSQLPSDWCRLFSGAAGRMPPRDARFGPACQIPYMDMGRWRGEGQGEGRGREGGWEGQGRGGEWEGRGRESGSEDGMGRSMRGEEGRQGRSRGSGREGGGESRTSGRESTGRSQGGRGPRDM